MPALLQEVKVDALGMQGLHLTINREDKANALTSELLDEIKSGFESATELEDIRYVVFTGVGKHFCAGADLNWMRESAKLDQAGNLKEAQRLSSMFQAIAECPLPTIVFAKGRVYGGAVGLVAACDVVVADERTLFCLSEARLGIIPAVITPYLLQRLSVGKVRQLSVTTKELGASEAASLGLVDTVVDANADAQGWLGEYLPYIKKSGPGAVARMKALLRTDLSFDTCQKAIADARSSAEGKAGLDAFFAKSAPTWANK